MNMWTDEAVRAEAAYRREQLHRMASHRVSAAQRRSGGWRKWLPSGRRH
ncbi:MAG TPA: hypothetical protein VFW65_07180 [Pseudonocardiaceae bacterium]|nr:hypothetical protein [Pseudonocardiaceae bacterium]